MPCATSLRCSKPPRSDAPYGDRDGGEGSWPTGNTPLLRLRSTGLPAKPEQWPDLKSFAVIESARCIKGKTSIERRFYLSSLAPDADRLARAIRAHWSIENRLHWCMDVAFADDQMRARSGHAAHNLAILKHITLNLIRLDPSPRRAASRLDDSSPPLPTSIALNCSDSLDVHAIALHEAEFVCQIKH